MARRLLVVRIHPGADPPSTMSTRRQSGGAAPNVLLRADGNAKIGTGHVMRSLALAHESRLRGAEAAFLMSTDSAGLLDRVREDGFRAYELACTPGSGDDAKFTSELAQQIEAGWIIADGYTFGGDYQRDLKARRHRVLFLDDYGHADGYAADVVVNQNPSALDSWYSHRDAGTSLLLGPRYALLRDEFLRYGARRRSVRKRGRSVLVTMGGSDPTDATRLVLRALDARSFDVTAVVGPAYPHAISGDARVVRDARNMPDLMARADVAVAAGGTTTLELAFMGLPALLLELADNQAAIIAELEREGIALGLGRAGAVDEMTVVTSVEDLLADGTRRAAMSHRGLGAVDGQGRRRVFDRMAEIGPVRRDVS
jgi:UDP-2,4-diacetamido-2,4,6-trideoxy-beta-L-altropyranose hydrolase